MVKPGKLPPSYKRWKKEQDFYFYCTCGCNNGVVIKTETEGDEVCLSLVSDTFYSNQRGFFALLMEKLRRIWCIIRNNEYYYFDIILDKQQANHLAEVLRRNITVKQHF